MAGRALSKCTHWCLSSCSADNESNALIVHAIRRSRILLRSDHCSVVKKDLSQYSRTVNGRFTGSSANQNKNNNSELMTLGTHQQFHSRSFKGKILYVYAGWVRSIRLNYFHELCVVCLYAESQPFFHHCSPIYDEWSWHPQWNR